MSRRHPGASSDDHGTGEKPTRLYAADSIEITTVHFTVAGRRYRVSELSHLVVLRGSVHAGVAVALVIAIASALAIIGVSLLMDDWRILSTGFPIIAIPCIAAIFCAYRWPPQMTLCAEYHGFQVALFRSRDSNEFGKVVRATRRAIEAAHEWYR